MPNIILTLELWVHYSPILKNEQFLSGSVLLESNFPILDKVQRYENSKLPKVYNQVSFFISLKLKAAKSESLLLFYS